MPNVAELMQRLPENVDASALADVNATLQLDLSGAGGGQWVVRLADGKVTTEEGTAAAPDATLHMAAEDYEAMLGGRLNPMTAFVQQKIKVEGDLSTVMKLQSLFS
ncbi:MAG: SCP2 sterol-binding domain-containing protein [Candidatus Promineifilaceae bacterium]